ncbi:GntR family transcriptional regulator [Tropicibacter naphthalenivorans]|uniref:Putative HTH-type transcriptional regulator YdfH n=1 Tax=Tropicibacter naphthalenivorans TaxID=441103 RepID=A0A0P1G924_9RHOB|nr:GntR family transcriptional regulator [Tropicibacter naphthalenivorans]CUH78087.1 putative HTH-type transcriptional regulator YdfH [Tropicibacter naphthalenivorans]SMC93788.1 transcriptional regulator, GntR family [Tropicibacter naphthalenivorans]
MTEASDRFTRLYSALRERICLLDAPPGTKLSEEALAAEFGTSRTPLRRVLARLEDEGLVESRHGVGTLVTDVDAEELRQVYALRLELTHLAGVLSPAPITDETRAQLEDFVQRADALAAAPTPRGFAQLNMDYHAFGLSLTGNVALREASERLYFRTARIWLQSIPRMDLASECAIFLDELHQTRTALAANDPQAAALIRRAHISMSMNRLYA